MSREVLAASMVMLKLIPTAPNSISWRRPNFSIVNTAIQEAAKYSRHRVSYGSGSRAEQWHRVKSTRSVGSGQNSRCERI